MRTRQNQYPIQFSVDSPDRELNRVTTLFSLFMVIPIALVLGAVSGAHGRTSTTTAPGTFPEGGAPQAWPLNQKEGGPD
jgi:hypothetical protein